MKMLSMFVASALLATSAAYAADAPAKTKPAAAAVTADHHCRDNADTKKLAGAARKSFIKKCRADTPAKKP